MRADRRPIELPSGLSWWRDEPGGRERLDRLPGIVEELADRRSATK
jgi:hypothetical protein